MNFKLDIVLSIKTNLKLNIVKKGGEQSLSLLRETDYEDDEIHYIKIEGVFHSFKMESIFQTLMKQMRATSQFDGPIAKKLEMIDNWTITDLDFCLKGNPYI
jgi:hypothetical protein